MTVELDPSRPSTLEASPQARVIDPLEQQGWLDTAGDAITAVLDPLLNHPVGAVVKDFLHGRWLGHALHPVLSDLPIGFWSASIVLDAVGESNAAGIMTAAGSAAAVATAASGTADWTALHGRERRLGLLHGFVNVAGLALQIGSLAARLGGRRRTAQGLSLAGFTVSSAAAFLGGELVFGRGVMVNHDAWLAGPQEWTAVLPSETLRLGATAKVEVEGRAVLLYRSSRGVSAMENACTHAGGPLDEGSVADGRVTCPWHGSEFQLEDGGVCRGPATYPQLRLAAREREGWIEVRGREG